MLLQVTSSAERDDFMWFLDNVGVMKLDLVLAATVTAIIRWYFAAFLEHVTVASSNVSFSLCG